MPRPRRNAAPPIPSKPVPTHPAVSIDTIDPDLQEWLHALIPRVNAGDETAAQAILAACKETPRLWAILSALAGRAERAWIDLLLGSHQSALTREILEQELTRKRRELAGTSPSPLEALLVERIVVSWMAASHADAEYARKLKAGMSLREGEYLARRCEQTNRQLLKAIESLARVRRLLTPMQVNIGQNQINVAQECGSDALIAW